MWKCLNHTLLVSYGLDVPTVTTACRGETINTVIVCVQSSSESSTKKKSSLDFVDRTWVIFSRTFFLNYWFTN